MLGAVLQMHGRGLAVWLVIALVATAVARTALRAAIAMCLALVGASMVVWTVEWAESLVVPSGVRRVVFLGVLLAMLVTMRLKVEWTESDWSVERWGAASATVLLAWVGRWSPRSAEESLGFLYPEDNEKWLQPLMAAERGALPSIVVPNETRNMQFAFRMLLDLVAGVGPGGEAAVMTVDRALAALSNALLLALAMSLLLVPLAVDALWRWLSTTGSLGTWRAVTSITSQLVCIYVFGQAQSVGHVPAYVASVLGLCAAIFALRVDLSQTTPHRTSASLLASVAAVGLVGTYNPWAPVAALLLLAVMVARFGSSLLRVLMRHWSILLLSVVGAVTVGAVLVRGFLARLGDLDEAASTATVHVEALWVMVTLVPLLVWVIGWCGPAAESVVDRVDRAGGSGVLVAVRPLGLASALALVVLVAVQLMGSDESQKVAFAAVVIMLVPLAVLSFRHRSAHDGASTGVRWVFITYLAGSVAYAALLWVLSRYLGPPFEPRYAAWKSLLLVIAQFGWVAVVLVVWVVSRLPRGIAIPLLPAAILSLGLIFGFQSRVNETYVHSKWWHEPVLTSLAIRPEEPIVCAVATYGYPDYETYTCNRFLETLSRTSQPAGAFRYAAWYDNEAVQRGLTWMTTHDVKRLTVLSQDDLDGQWLDRLRTVPTLSVRQIVVRGDP
jgi:hypothetical protein